MLVQPQALSGSQSLWQPPYLVNQVPMLSGPVLSSVVTEMDSCPVTFAYWWWSNLAAAKAAIRPSSEQLPVFLIPRPSSSFRFEIKQLKLSYECFRRVPGFFAQFRSWVILCSSWISQGTIALGRNWDWVFSRMESYKLMKTSWASHRWPSHQCSSLTCVCLWINFDVKSVQSHAAGVHGNYSCRKNYPSWFLQCAILSNRPEASPNSQSWAWPLPCPMQARSTSPRNSIWMDHYTDRRLTAALVIFLWYGVDPVLRWPLPVDVLWTILIQRNRPYSPRHRHLARHAILISSLLGSVFWKVLCPERPSSHFFHKYPQPRCRSNDQSMLCSRYLQCTSSMGPLVVRLVTSAFTCRLAASFIWTP